MHCLAYVATNLYLLFFSVRLFDYLKRAYDEGNHSRKELHLDDQPINTCSVFHFNP